MPDTPKDEAFLSRWSRKKRAPEEIAEVQSPTGPAVVPETSDIPDEDLSDVELLAKYELPDPDTMSQGDDFSAFMKSAVPDRLRRRALRVLWGSNPILANLDELVDYGEDYTDAATVIENMQTIYQVGKGAAWKFQEEQVRIAEAEALAEAEAAERRAHNGEPLDDTEQSHAVDDDVEEDAEALASERVEEDAPQDLNEDLIAAAETAPPRPKAMRFQFD